MSNKSGPTIIKKYANRRLYNTGTSTYVTLDDLGAMVRNEEDFVVYDAKSGDDITRTVLTQIIFEQENSGQNMLPVDFLRQLIRFYGDSMQAVVPSFLDHSMKAFAADQEKMKEQFGQAFTNPAMGIGSMEEQVRRNAEMFQNAMSMFMPFAAPAAAEPEPEEAQKTDASELGTLKDQLAEMQQKLNELAKKK